MHENDVAFLKSVTRATPPQFLGQPTAKNDRSQLLTLFLPLFGFREKEINFGICSALCHSIEAIMVRGAVFGRATDKFLRLGIRAVVNLPLAVAHETIVVE